MKNMESQKDSPGTFFTPDLILPNRFFPPRNPNDFQKLLDWQNASGTFSSFLWKHVRMTVGHFPPFFQTLSEWQWDIFLLFSKTCQNEGGIFSSILWKLDRMTVGHFPPFCENLSEWRWEIFLLFVKTCQNGSQTLSSFYWKLVRMMVRHFPPFRENLSEWQLDIFLLFVKTCQNDSGTFSSFVWKFVGMTVGHFPPFWEKRRKISLCHSHKFLKKGGKCPTVIRTSFQKKEENVLLTF